MLGIDKYGQMYLAMIGAFGNPEAQSKICNENGISLVQWDEANAHYTAKMSDVSDMGQTAMALAKYMMPHNAPGAPKDDTPVDFIAIDVRLYVNENNVQMAEFINGDRHVILQYGVDNDPNDEFIANYVQGRVHMLVNDQSYSIYGGVERVELFRNNLIFHFDQEGKERMKRDTLTITFLISNTKYGYLERTLYHMYKDHPVLVLSKEKPSEIENWNGIEYDLTRGSFGFENGGIVNLRTNIGNLQETGKYNQSVAITFEKEGTSKELFEAFLNEMMAVMEADYESIISMIIIEDEKNELFLYTQLSERDFMERVNTALCYLPNLALGFSAEPDTEWVHYKACLQDYLDSRS
ncbi:Imm10 family immunity protein [Fluviicola taffensis]|uniref:DUF695 domain-containing protein n=1 Tax=Fluviicola taffensis (strain DSM 16823 / NCIMB 13979 / RW262) TaxID=755732 RepID=F2IEL8_FLUTR|nr:Imm10 family immunity protein [Fluviicola taffensis]AEA44557.1 hypothetical protein Fluta_2573 [Fluviicola taffensis DSM 16823]